MSETANPGNRHFTVTRYTVRTH